VRPIRRASLGVALLAACAQESAIPAPPAAATAVAPSAPAAAPASAVQDCASRVAGMRDVFASGPAEPVIIPLLAGMELPDSRDGTAITDGLPIYILADGSFNYNATPLAAVTDAEARIKQDLVHAQAFAEARERPFHPTLLLIVDRRAPISVIDALARSLPVTMNYAQVVDLSGDGVPPPPPIPAWVDAAYNTADLVDAADYQERRVAAISRAIGSCDAVREAFAAAADASFEDRERALIGRVPPAVLRCRCESVDVEALTAILWHSAGKKAPARRLLPLRLRQDRGARSVRLPANATGADLARLAEERAGRPFRLSLTAAG